MKKLQQGGSSLAKVIQYVFDGDVSNVTRLVVKKGLSYTEFSSPEVGFEKKSVKLVVQQLFPIEPSSVNRYILTHADYAARCVEDVALPLQQGGCQKPLICFADFIYPKKC